MAQLQEREVKQQFLVEAKEYLDTIEMELLKTGNSGISPEAMDAVLRAAHSVKGGAAMMGFITLSQLAHRLEDFFKVLKAGRLKTVEVDVINLLLSCTDALAKVAEVNSQGTDVDAHWLAANADPIIEELHERLGDPLPEDAAALLSAEVGEDMKALLFETEVEGCLQRLEGVLAAPNNPCLSQEFLITAQEFEGLGEMLELGAFSSLCRSVVQNLEGRPQDAEEIARQALAQWRRSQALVIIGQIAELPRQLDLDPSESANSKTETPSLDENLGEIWLPSEELELLTLDPAEHPAFCELEVNPTNPADKILDFNLEAYNADSFLDKTEIRESPSQSQLPASEPLEESVAPISEDSDRTIRIPVKQLAKLTNLFGELTIERNGLDLHLKRLRNLMTLLNQRVQFLEQANFRLRNTHDRVATQSSNSPLVPFNLSRLASADRQEFDFLEMDRYNDLHLVSQDIMETAVQIQEVYTDLETSLLDSEKAARDIARTSKLMQNGFSELQMRPLSDLLGRFSRALRDMELKYGKRVKLKVKGGSTLLDRSILEALSDPLMHLFRNAFDHGIENSETRASLGKPLVGTIEIAASYRGNKTIIEIRDDGGGIPIDKIKAKALQMGLSAEDLEAVGDKELLDLIFEPGFSTADKVTDLSGRGVGMDVVRTNLRQIRGDIQVDTRAGRGTTFTITVPFTLSVVRALLVESGGLMVAFPANAVEEMLQLHPEMTQVVNGKEILNWEGFEVPLLRLSKCLQFSSSLASASGENAPAVDAPTVLMVAKGEELTAIQIDRYWAEQEVTIRQVEGNIPLPAGFSGCTILGDGRVVPFVDTMALLSAIESNSGRSSLSQAIDTIKKDAAKSANSIQKNTILVVDDSINVRRFLALTLEKANYRVEQAKDGREALEKLQAGLQVQAVVSDVEMPRLDGYGFLAQVKSDANCKDIPVVMLTSRSGDKHRQLAMSLGATAYFSKPFREQELLKTLKQLVGNRSESKKAEEVLLR